jgi:chemotaxis methyl-accepting protein methylase
MTFMGESPMNNTAILEGSVLVEQLTGVVVPEYRQPLLRAEFERIGGQSGITGGIDRVMSGDSTARSQLISTVTIPETYLFRHFGHFEIIREMAIERAKSGKGTRILSAGCSTGEEVWSAAAILAALPFTPGVRHEVVGWELCGERLRTARDGRYTKWSCRNGLKGFDGLFEERDGVTEVGRRLRELVSFSQVNLVDGELPVVGHFDAVFLRNVAIYWSESTSESVCSKLASLIADDGLLFVGPSDPVQLSSTEWEHRITHGVRSYRRIPYESREPQKTEPQASRASERVPDSPSAPTIPENRAATKISETASRIRMPLFLSNCWPEKSNGSNQQPDGWIADPSTDTPDQSCLDLARALADTGEYQAALSLLENDDEGQSVDGKLWRGILSLSLENNVEAVRLFRQCVFLRPEVSEYLRWLSVGLEAIGRDQEAQRCRMNAFELGDQ